MGASNGRRSGRAGRTPMRSPGRPMAGRREHRQRFWKEIALGLSSEDSALVAGISEPVGTRWFRENGGMPPRNLVELSRRYLSFAEREEIALLHAQDFGFVRLLGASGVPRRRFRVSCEETRQPEVEDLNIARQRHNGTLS